MKVVINMVYMQSDRDPGLLLVNPNYNLKMSHIFKLVPQVEVRVARRAGTAARTAPQRRALPAIAAGAFTCHREDRVNPAERVLARRSAGFHNQPCLCSPFCLCTAVQVLATGAARQKSFKVMVSIRFPVTG